MLVQKRTSVGDCAKLIAVVSCAVAIGCGANNSVNPEWGDSPPNTGAREGQSTESVQPAGNSSVPTVGASTGSPPTNDSEPGGTASSVEPTSAPLVTSDGCTSSGQVFRVIPRLNRAEYNNTVRDLIGDTSNAALTDLPPDQGDGGFDNNTAALTTTPAQVESYFALAEKLGAAALAGAGRALIVTCDPLASGEAQCAQQIATTFGARAYRRPLEASEVTNLVNVYAAIRELGFSWEEGITALVQATLSSPHFLYRPEIDTQATAERALGGFEIASRLSYYLWSTMPDAALMDAAGNGELTTPDGVKTQVQRMLQDPKADALYDRFPSLWLRIYAVDERPPAPTIFPTYDEALSSAMVEETRLFMRELMTSNTSFLDLLDADFTYVNKRLAEHYGLDGNFGDEFVRVDLAGNPQRGGILTHASVLRLTSPSERTSAVIRGSWILARILNAPPPPPPDTLDVPDLEETAAGTQLTTRQRLELHRADPQCAACHSVIDPLGFGLENYDGIGAWRDEENGSAVDATSVLITGEAIDGHQSLARVLKADPKTARGIVRYVLSYALGRTSSAEDNCRVETLNAAFAAGNYRMQDLLASVASDDAFLTRKVSP